MSHESAHFFTKQPFSFENSGCSLISVYAFVPSNQGYCDLHTQHMTMEKTAKRFQSNPVQKHCYLIIDRSYMTETMLIVILSTNAPTMIIKIKAKKKKQ